MSDHVMRGRFTPRCPDGTTVDYSTAWPTLVRIPLLLIITLFFMRIHPDVSDVFKRAVWMIVKPMALMIGYFFVAVVRILIFAFVDGPKMVINLIKRDDTNYVNVLNTVDVKNNTKLSAIMGRLHDGEADAWMPGRVFDKKYKPYLVADKMNFAGPRQKNAMTRKRGISC